MKMKRILAAVICLLLAVSTCLNGNAADETATLTKAQKNELEQFLSDYYLASWGRYFYDYSEITYPSILSLLLSECSFSAFYPGIADYDVVMYENKPDPRSVYNKLSYNSGYSYDKCNAAQVEWVAENVFHCSEPMLQEMRNMGEKRLSSDSDEFLFSFYKEGSYYYCYSSGIGGNTNFEVKTNTVLSDGECFYVTYTIYSFQDDDPSKVLTPVRTAYARLQYTTADGHVFWSLYKDSQTKFWNDEDIRAAALTTTIPAVPTTSRPVTTINPPAAKPAAPPTTKRAVPAATRAPETLPALVTQTTAPDGSGQVQLDGQDYLLLRFEDFNYILQQLEVLITQYLGTAQRVEIPAEIEAHPVIGVADNAFAQSQATEVVVPASVYRFGEHAFESQQGKMKLICEEGSPAAQYAQKNGNPVEFRQVYTTAAATEAAAEAATEAAAPTRSLRPLLFGVAAGIVMLGLLAAILMLARRKK